MVSYLNFVEALKLKLHQLSINHVYESQEQSIHTDIVIYTLAKIIPTLINYLRVQNFTTIDVSTVNVFMPKWYNVFLYFAVICKLIPGIAHQN